MSTTPVVTATSPVVNAAQLQVFAASQLFSASDTGGDPILDYQVEDNTTGPNAGFWVLDGAVLPNGQITELSAAQLSELFFVAGNGSETDTLDVAASDVAGFGAFTPFSVTTPGGIAGPAAPSVSATNAIDGPNLDIAASSLFSGIAFGGQSIVAYEVEDTTADSGHWVFNGAVEPAGQLVFVGAGQLSELSFATGYGTDTIMVRAEDGAQWSNYTTFTVQPPANPSPPAGTMAELVILRGADGAYEFYDIGHNQILLDGPVGEINPAWQVAGIGGFDGTDTADMLMRNPTTGAFELYDVSNNAVTGSIAFGQVGVEWQVAGFGDFSSRAGETDMLMRDSLTGAFDLYDISNNKIASSASMGQVGLQWQVAGFGDFSGRDNETDMLMRDTSTGAFEVYDIGNNAITSNNAMGQVGLEWQVAGFGDFSGKSNETDMLMRNSTTGAFEVYDIRNNAIVSSAAIGAVGLEWTISGFGDFSGNANETDMLMQDSQNGKFEIFDITGNAVTSATPMGQVGSEWSISGIVGGASAGSQGTALSGLSVEPASAPASASLTQLTQAMAAFAPADGALAASSPLDQMPAPTANPLATPTNQIPQG